MSKKNPLASMEALKAITITSKLAPEAGSAKQETQAGEKAVSKARKKAAAEKNRTIGFRSGQRDLEIIESLAIKLKRYGLQYSEANAIRLALRTFNASSDQIEKVAREIHSEDGRRQR